MPKLSKDSLEKRFICQYCGKSFRTRQGLSGHIQFRHGNGQKSSEIDASEVLSKGLEIKLWGEIRNLPSSAIKARQRILVDWLEDQALCNFLQIKLNPQDFKTYYITRLAKIHGKDT